MLMSSESSETQDSVLTTGTSKVFADYCQVEFERRRNSGQDFDEEAYIEAMHFALARLHILEEEGLA